LLLVPGLYAATRASGRAAIRELLPGVVPVAAWALFALLYYGSPVPNPTIAAWHGMGSLAERIGQGGAYLLDGFDRDPLTMVVILIATSTIGSPRLREVRPIWGGLVLYLIVLIGMGGIP